MSKLDFNEFLEHCRARVDEALEQQLPKPPASGKNLIEAMRYSLLSGGKRVRPVLAYAAAQSFGAITPATDAVACSLEAIHAYSLIHDDLPAMDDDELRRGQPTCHIAFDEACSKAQERGIRVTGSELVGLVPLKVMTDAADYFLHKQQRSTGISESEKIKIAIKSLGLDDLAPFNPEERIIEYLIGGLGSFPLLEKNLREFSDDTASESPAPGGGSIAAYSGALGTALSTMVANLSANKRGWDDRWEEFSNWADKGQTYHSRLLALVDADTAAFNGIMDAYGLPKSTKDQKTTRAQAIQSATKHAIEVPMQVAEVAHDAFEVAEAMADFGNPNSITDAGVGAMCLRTAVLGAVLNARVNTADLIDKEFVSSILSRCDELVTSASSREAAVLSRVDEVLG